VSSRTLNDGDCRFREETNCIINDSFCGCYSDSNLEEQWSREPQAIRASVSPMSAELKATNASFSCPILKYVYLFISP
jgi:hypothetical protein